MIDLILFGIKLFLYFNGFNSFDAGWFDGAESFLIWLFELLLLFFLNLYDVFVLFKLSLHMYYLFVLGKELLVHTVHGDLALLSFALQVVDFPCQAFIFDSFLVEFALELANPNFIVLFLLSNNHIDIVFLLLQLLDACIVLFELCLLHLECFEEFLGLGG